MTDLAVIILNRQELYGILNRQKLPHPDFCFLRALGQVAEMGILPM